MLRHLCQCGTIGFRLGLAGLLLHLAPIQHRRNNADSANRLALPTELRCIRQRTTLENVLFRSLGASNPSPDFVQCVVNSYSPVPPLQLSVWNGDAGRPAELTRFGLAVLCQPKRTVLGLVTWLAETITVLPSTMASAATNLPSFPAT